MGESSADLRVARRQGLVPQVRYPPALPISGQVGEIATAIRDHQVVVVAGETGSGKTTQLPKICLELGRGIRGTIGHTQPRRLAARTVAERIAQELDVPLGGAVGWKVRFTDQGTEGTLIKLMTDGILLAELQSDPLLRQYDTLIIDEAHERSLNIDFILGYLKRLLPRRPDLAVVITSATIDPERFSRHFDGAPVIEVSGRTYPVEIRYRPVGVDRADDRDQTQAICDAVAELRGEGPGDILVFLSGEREIRDTRDALEGLDVPGTEILPLFARLSSAEQYRVFQPPRSFQGQRMRRIVLATNVAETSLTVPGIRYVIDPGTARISRYSRRLKVQRLPIEPISQASATQRAGRCGRTADGICVRLYSEDDFASRAEFTDPEIARTHLASVVLQMSALNLGEVADFPFIDPPDRRQISDGMALLRELGALEGRPTGELADLQEPPTTRLTGIGRTLAKLPVDPRLARMVVAAEHNGCLGEVLVIVAALSIQDPRERPADAEAAADAQHARFTVKDSDFLGLLTLWRYLDEQQRARSSSQFRKLCRAEFLHYLRVREWQDLHGQLRRICRDSKMAVNTAAADPQQVHVSLLAGLLSHIGLLDPETRDYLGARGARFAVFPGSALFRRPPRWVMAAELVETSRLWGRTAARIEPQWVESLAGHLVKRSYSEPHWERHQGAAVAYEKVTLYGIPIVTGRKTGYGKIDPECSRELFIRHALVEGDVADDWGTRHAFFQANRAVLEDVEELAHRSRRRDLVVDEEVLFDFYDQRISDGIVSCRHFDSWWRKAAAEPGLLDFDPATLISGAAINEQDYPRSWRQGTVELELSYQFEPGAESDGVTVQVPLVVLNQLTAAPFSWQVPGLRAELVIALLKSLPKPLRRALVPVPDHARALLARMASRREGESLLGFLERELTQAGVPVHRGDWELDRVPDHLVVTFRVAEGGRVLAHGKDLEALQRRLAPQLRATLAAASGDLQRQGLRSWEVGTLPQVHQHEQAGHLVTGYPALVDEGDTVAVALLPTEAEQQRAMWAGTRRLLLLALPGLIKSAQRGLDRQARLVLARTPHGSTDALLADCAGCAADALIAAYGGPPRDEAGFTRLRERAQDELAGALRAVIAHAQRILAAAHTAESQLAELTAPVYAGAVADVRAQLGTLVGPGFVTATGAQRLPDLARYLHAIVRRLDKLPRDPDRDRDWMHRIALVTQAHQQLREDIGDGPELQRIGWMIQELRVSYFAQELRTPYPVSDQRIYQAITAARS